MVLLNGSIELQAEDTTARYESRSNKQQQKGDGRLSTEKQQQATMRRQTRRSFNLSTSKLRTMCRGILGRARDESRYLEASDVFSLQQTTLQREVSTSSTWDGGSVCIEPLVHSQHGAIVKVLETLIKSHVISSGHEY